ncbi:MAG: hypothetical protein KTR31_27650, partial [Myxococcales bacterium]|nr:hypothetical protein [Myxococcales bacterium]
MSRTGLLWTLATLVACTGTIPDPDCDAWQLGMDYEQGVPVFSLDVPTVDGEVARRTLGVSRSSNARRPSQWCDSGVNTSEPLWEVVGRFDEVTYLQVPEDARETWNADRDRSTPGPTTRLREGQLYVSDVFLNADRGLRGISCPR